MIKSSLLSSWVDVKTELFTHISCLFLIVWKSLKNVASLNFSFTTVYKNVPSAPNVGSPAVPPSARNKLQKYNSNETQTGFECMTVIFIKRLLKTFRDFQRLTETFREMWRFISFWNVTLTVTWTKVATCKNNSHGQKFQNKSRQT